MRYFINPNFKECPFCSTISQKDNPNPGCSCWFNDKNYESVLRFCCICGKELLSYDEWHKRQTAEIEEYEAYLKEHKQNESQD